VNNLITVKIQRNIKKYVIFNVYKIYNILIVLADRKKDTQERIIINYRKLIYKVKLLLTFELQDRSICICLIIAVTIEI